MEDGETSKRKNRNAVRKMAAGEEGCFQEANHHHRDLRVLPRANSRTGLIPVGRGAGGHSKRMSFGIWGLPGHLGHHLATNSKGLAVGDDNRHGAHSQPQQCQDQRHFWQQTPKMLSAASVGL